MDTLDRIIAAVTELTAEGGKSPTYSEIAERLQMAHKTIRTRVAEAPHVFEVLVRRRSADWGQGMCRKHVVHRVRLRSGVDTLVSP